MIFVKDILDGYNIEPPGMRRGKCAEARTRKIRSRHCELNDPRSSISCFPTINWNLFGRRVSSPTDLSELRSGGWRPYLSDSMGHMVWTALASIFGTIARAIPGDLRMDEGWAQSDRFNLDACQDVAHQQSQLTSSSQPMRVRIQNCAAHGVCASIRTGCGWSLNMLREAREAEKRGVGIRV